MISLFKNLSAVKLLNFDMHVLLLSNILYKRAHHFSRYKFTIII
jgi:hypothetical protein